MKEISHGFSNVKGFKSLLFKMSYGDVRGWRGGIWVILVHEVIVMNVFWIPDYFLIQLRLSPLVA